MEKKIIYINLALVLSVVLYIVKPDYEYVDKLED